MGERFGQRLSVVALHVVVISGAAVDGCADRFHDLLVLQNDDRDFHPAAMAAARRMVIQELRNSADQSWPFPYWYINSLIYAGGGDGFCALLLLAGRLRLRQV